MRIFGFEITRRKDVPPSLFPPSSFGWGGWGTWFGPIQESFSGAWQRNVEIRTDFVLTFSAVYSCVTLIAKDIGKLGLDLIEEDANGVEKQVEVAAFSPVLRKPNRYQTRQQFIENWVTSKLIHGNAYILKERDNRNVVTALYVLDPLLTKPLIAPDGEVYYQLSINQLAGVENTDVIAPADEIIHDVMCPLYHPLCGVSPITACGLPAMQGLNIQNNSTKFFANGSNPGGVLTAPGTINDETAKRLKDYWEQNYTGKNVGRIAVLGDGLKYEPMMVNAVDADLINQLKWSAETVCSCFHVPPYMIGVGPQPTYNSIEALNQQYYSQCLQTLIEAIEALLDDGLGLTQITTHDYETEFDLSDLLRMDSATNIRSWGELVTRGIASPNEARAEFQLGPVTGGESPYLQQQNYSLAALDKRDTLADPFGVAPKPAPAINPAIQPPPPQKLLPSPKLNGDEIYRIMESAL